MVRAAARGGGRKAAVSYVEDNDDSGPADSEGEQETRNQKIKKLAVQSLRASNGSKRKNQKEYSDEDEEDATPPLPSPKKNKPAAKPVYKDDSSDDDVVDDGQLEGEGSDYEASKPKKSPAKKSPKKTPAKKTVTKKSPKKKAAVTPSRASGRAVQSIKYADDDNDEEEEEEDEEESEDEAPLRGRGKVAAKAKAPFKKAKMAAHPPVSEMIPIAIRKLNENPKKGSSMAAIKGYMAEEWGVNIKAISTKIKNYITNAVEDGEVIQRKGKGMSGRFTLPGMKRKGKKRKRIIKDEDDEKAMDEHEYKPVKNARDEEREKDEAEKERRRQERKEKELKRELEKADQPKREVKRKSEWTVEFIKSMRVVDEKTWYQVKFEGYKKLSWEPEEHLDTCKDIIDNFLIEEKVRLAQLAEKKRREEEEGKYEVGKVLEVKFPKGKPREFLIRWKGHGEEMDSWEPENNLDCSDLIQRFMLRHEKRLEATEKSLRVAPKRVERLQFAASHRVSKRNQGFRTTYEDMDE